MQDVAQYRPHHVTYATAKFEVVKGEMHLQESTLSDLDLEGHTQIVTQYPLHHVTYAPARFRGRYKYKKRDGRMD